MEYELGKKIEEIQAQMDQLTRLVYALAIKQGIIKKDQQEEEEEEKPQEKKSTSKKKTKEEELDDEIKKLGLTL